MKNIQMNSDWLRVALLLSEISLLTTFCWLARRGMQNKQASVANIIHDHHVFEAQAIRFFDKR